MSHIHNLSHLKNTTITPAPTPQLTYQLAQNGLKIYQANKMQNNHSQQTATRMVRPPPTVNHNHRPPPTSTALISTPGRKGVNYPHRIISNAITLTPTTPNHFTNSPAQHIQFQQHSQLQQQLRKPTILAHPQQRGPPPPPNQQFVNHTPAHQPAPQQLKPGVVRYTPTTPPQPHNNVSHQNHISNHISVYEQHHVLNNHGVHVQYNSPTKVPISYPAPTHPHPSGTGLGGGGLNNGGNTLPTIKQSNKRNSAPGSGGQTKSSNQSSNLSGGAARVQHVLNPNRKSITKNSSPKLTEPGTATIKQESVGGSGALSPKKKQGKAQRLSTSTSTMPNPVIVKTEDIPKPNITTEHVLRGPRPFQKGDDVLLTTDDGTFLFGTVGMVHGQTLQIMFGDGTQQLASFNKVKLLSCSVDEEEDEDASNNTATSADLSNHVDVDTTTPGSKNIPMKSNKVGGNSLGSSNSNPHATTNAVLANEEVTCGSCGVVKRVAGKKALNYAPHTKTQFNCRRCVNKSRFGNKGSMPIPIPATPNRGKSSSTSSSPNSTSKSSNNRRTSDDNGRGNICFHCEKTTNNNDRLHCNLCERACHLSCLAMTPTPLEGDRFWDVICSACGTQNGDSSSTARSKVFSCRRSISSWSDVAHLILSCLASDPENDTGERFFDLEKDIIPFIMQNTDRLHLPRTYKNIQPESRKDFLSTALHNATLRFLNGGEVHRKGSLWAIRENNNHQGYPLRVISKTPTKNKIKVPTATTTTPNGTRLTRTPNNKWTSTLIPGTGQASTGKEGSGRCKGTPSKTDSDARNSPKRKSKEDDPPELDKYDAPFITGSTPSKSSRVMSQTERLVQKAKKTCLKTKEGASDTNSKRKASESSGGSPQSKRLKLSPENGMNGVTRTPPSKKIPSPIPNKQFAQWLDCLNSNGNRKLVGSPISHVGSPSLSEASSSLFGKAVKSAGITPPGNYASSPEKPSLRLRKPKPFNLKGNEKDKTKINGMVPPKLFAKLKGRLTGKQAKSNAATARFSQIPLSNGAIKEEDQSDISQTEFSFLNSRVQDLIDCGVGYTIHCLPEGQISTAKELKSIKEKVAAAYASEVSSAPPAYLNFTPSSGAKLNRKEKSKRNLKNVRSFEVTGRRVDAGGNIQYQLEWKDGYGNGSDDEDQNELLLDWDSPNDPETIIEVVDKLQEVILNGHHDHIDLRGQEDKCLEVIEDNAKASEEPINQNARVAKNEKIQQTPWPRSSPSEFVIDLTCDD